MFRTTIQKLSKTNLLAACLMASIIGIISNIVFNFTGSFFFCVSTVDITNNVIDLLQICFYVLVKIFYTGRLNRYDLPFLLGGAVSLAY